MFMLSKSGIKKILISTGVLLVILFIVNTLTINSACVFSGTWCVSIIVNLFRYSTPLVPFFFVGLFIFWLKDFLLEKWYRFSIVYLLFTWLLIFLAPSMSIGMFNFFPIDKGRVSLFMSGLFAVISIIWIVTHLIILKVRSRK